MPSFNANKPQDIAKTFESLGAEFVLSPQKLYHKLKNIHAFVFDWDGVFNDGTKSVQQGSTYAEPDAMALHILRYGYWRIHGKLPIVAIITGQNNENAFHLAEREHLTTILAGYRNKYEALDIFKKTYQLKKEDIATVFDDIIDYPLADSSSIRFLVKRNASPLMTEVFKKHQLCDYITACPSGQFPVREISELINGLWGNYDDMLLSRFKDPAAYEVFWTARQEVKTEKIIC